tara:strand:+ start:305 stop:844 length:540 start_codon:yes stop_codon:yes gene_type:complete
VIYFIYVFISQQNRKGKGKKGHKTAVDNDAATLYESALHGTSFFRANESKWFLKSFGKKSKKENFKDVLENSHVKHLYSFMTGKAADPVVYVMFSPYYMNVGNIVVRCYMAYVLKKTLGTVQCVESGGFAVVESTPGKFLSFFSNYGDFYLSVTLFWVQAKNCQSENFLWPWKDNEAVL